MTVGPVPWLAERLGVPLLPNNNNNAGSFSPSSSSSSDAGLPAMLEFLTVLPQGRQRLARELLDVVLDLGPQRLRREVVRLHRPRGIMEERVGFPPGLRGGLPGLEPGAGGLAGGVVRGVVEGGDGLEERGGVGGSGGIHRYFFLPRLDWASERAREARKRERGDAR